MGAMHEFLLRLEDEDIRAVYAGLDERWNDRTALLNHKFTATGVPVQVSNLSSIFVVCYLTPSRYNWMFQYYLRAQGLALSWVGTGRLIFSLNYTDADFAQVCDRMLLAAAAMQRDGWWWADSALDNKAIKRSIMKEMLQARSFSTGSIGSPRSR
jgi:glutamate-1-semialdehyde 2,1-aminomutase